MVMNDRSIKTLEDIERLLIKQEQTIGELKKHRKFLGRIIGQQKRYAHKTDWDRVIKDRKMYWRHKKTGEIKYLIK